MSTMWVEKTRGMYIIISLLTFCVFRLRVLLDLITSSPCLFNCKNIIIFFSRRKKEIYKIFRPTIIARVNRVDSISPLEFWWRNKQFNKLPCLRHL